MEGIKDGSIFLEGGLGLVSSVLLGEVYVAVEEYDEVGLLLLLLLLFGSGCHSSWLLGGGGIVQL